MLTRSLQIRNLWLRRYRCMTRPLCLPLLLHEGSRVSLRLWRRTKQIRLITKLLLQAFGLSVDFCVFPPSFLFFPFFLFSLLFKELHCSALLFLLLPPSRSPIRFLLSLLLAGFGFYLRFETRGLGLDLPLRSRV
jgi:hypothetical protein